MKQIFIFSLPRSGSTLLQRTLMSHKEIVSISEPWILLPQVYSFKTEGHISEYSSLLASKGVNDLINNLPNKKLDYYQSLRKFINDLHVKLAKNNETYFLDKTPRYYLIIQEIREIFPDAKFIFLFRSPEQIYSSMINTWSNNKLKPFLGSYYDLTEGYEKLSNGYLKYKNESISLKYENFILNPEAELKRIMDYLDLEFDPEIIQRFSKQETGGSLGDPIGVLKYNTINNHGLNKWKYNLNTIFRKRIAMHLINKISEEALSVQSYNKIQILISLKSLKSKITFKDLRDVYDYSSNYFIRKYNMHLFLFKTFKWIKKKFIS